MSQVLTPEEMAALFEGLREAEDGPGSRSCCVPQEPASTSGILSAPGRSTISQNLSAWLMVLADLRWPNL